MNKDILTISFVMQKNGQTYLKNQVYLKNQIFASKDFKSMFDHFSTLRKKGLKYNIQEYLNGIISIILCKTLTLEIWKC